MYSLFMVLSLFYKCLLSPRCLSSARNLISICFLAQQDRHVTVETAVVLLHQLSFHDTIICASVYLGSVSSKKKKGKEKEKK